MREKSDQKEAKEVIVNEESIKEMSEPDQKILADFITEQVNKGIHDWQKGTHFDNHGNKLILEADLFERPRKNVVDKKTHQARTGLRVEILSNEFLGKGGQGSVFKTVGVLSINNEHVTFKHKSRAVKFSSEKPNIENIKNLDNIGVKEPVQWKTTKFATTMRLIKGFGLHKLSNNFYSYQPAERYNLNMSLNEKKALTLALLEAYKKQIYDENRVHRDIKPENIMLNISDGKFLPTFIDLDDAAVIGDICDVLPYSEGFTPREIVYKESMLIHQPGSGQPAKTSQDIYSLGKVLAQLWKEELDNPKNDEHSNNTNALGSIQNLIQKMTEDNPQERIDLDDALKLIDQVVFDLPVDNEKEIRRIFDNAVKIGDYKTAKKFLDKIDINYQDSKGWTALHHAVKSGNLKLVELLLKANADPKLVSNDSKTPFGYIDHNKNSWVPMINLLLESGSTFRSEDAILEKALLNKAPINFIKLLLANHHANPNDKPEVGLGGSGQKTITEAYLFPTPSNTEDWKPMPERIEIANLLLEHGGKSNWDQDTDGMWLYASEELKNLEVYLGNESFRENIRKDDSILPVLVSAIKNFTGEFSDSFDLDTDDDVNDEYFKQIVEILEEFSVEDNDSDREVYQKFSEMLQKLEKCYSDQSKLDKSIDIERNLKVLDELVDSARRLAKVSKEMGIEIPRPNELIEKNIDISPDPYKFN
ncbi:putative protein kinase [Legionella gratiana]|uniref:Serine/threonine protein kinase n=1 Tax=Legionella gratiana TaxID=45066 RepID=A0A378JF52_9GAMM|nr:ankyrin repeat domain-containing protein kinase [Legionella gratiana]KTD09220.1 putative protein kinase [Legionella gratiana]STX45527.1 Serine/threonine protein kinase [Legionella gratiana]